MTRTVFMLSVWFGVILNIELPKTTPSSSTALEARAHASTLIRKEAKNNTIEIFAAHNSEEITPHQWRVSFWDPVEKKVKIIQVIGKQAVDQSNNYEGYSMDPGSVSEFSEADAIDPIYLQIDSDRALEIASRIDEIKGLSISSVEYQLQKSVESVEPVWTLTFFTQTNDLELKSAQVQLSADSGEILHVTVTPNNIQSSTNETL